ncbi:16S rRNA (cytosine(1402)-N(4))-methyltransferase RsmH [Pseudoxanthomonas sp. F37]|uniref:16S rRNA (cytosine(1402)-N(4))-methyltransferase RsmH n=1 Tax=Pseudoxanthomonas TaxID=83618 RepID=UPI001FD2FAB3|nr:MULTISPECIES: 16S rRNA (cytosine(1402)-N(4))-methyltransferase RsmH [Pseudoxanthomonas]UOV04522.1 16S rRNA (cytosine(1402)-N(4))-methyltransferase RsmH [Pseudoxanthomonas mexicana]UOV09530.1 16S rRNA (cytosine(1402)-N(4))-methyltransferase RsmH [Pseudoxanthomonas sp. F37]
MSRGDGKRQSAPAGHPPALHLPVLYTQVMEGLQVKEDGTYLDGTFGRGGHARGVLQRLGPGGRLLLMDKDPDAIAHAEQMFAGDARVAIRRGSFAGLAQWDQAAAGLDGVLLDLGVSSPQLDVAERGFSFGKDGPLDMRMDPESGESAAQWIARADEREIADVLWTYGEEKQSRRIARAIVARRATQPFTRTADLAAVIASVMPRGDKIHPATRSFQAIRIHINRELADLELGLDAALACLRPGGRLAVISFHSLEDRIVKQFINRHAKAPPANRRLPVAETFVPTLRAIGSGQKGEPDEVAANPRARSAVLRVAEKLGIGDGQSGTATAGSGTGAAAGLAAATGGAA